MSKSPPIIPPHMQDVDLKPREEGETVRSERNPQGVRQCEYTGTPVKTARELEDDEIIRAAREANFRGRSVAEKIRVLLDQRRDLVTVEYFEKALADFTS